MPKQSSIKSHTIPRLSIVNICKQTNNNKKKKARREVTKMEDEKQINLFNKIYSHSMFTSFGQNPNEDEQSHE